MPPKAAAKTAAKTAKIAVGKVQKTTRSAKTAPKKAAAPKKATAPKKGAPPKKASAKAAATTKTLDASPRLQDEPTNGPARKRTRDDASGARPAKKPRVLKQAAQPKQAVPRATKAAPKKRVATGPPSLPPALNAAPTDVLNVYVFGTGDLGELGLGPKVKEALRPKLNPFLDAGKENGLAVVQVACGGVHSVALTRDNQIVTWGVNDKGALGRDTEWEGAMRDIDEDGDGADSDSDSDSDGLNPLESTPTAIPASSFPDGTTFAQVAAGDSCSLALTTTGLVYGWGTFLNNTGDKGFSLDEDGKLIKVQPTPRLIPGLTDVVQIVCGANHALARDVHGELWAWGVGQQSQLGHPLPDVANDDDDDDDSRNSSSSKHDEVREAYLPHRIEVSRAGVCYIASGGYHSFAVDGRGHVWGWGSNNFGQAGDTVTAGSDRAVVPYPAKIPALSHAGVIELAASSHHSAAIVVAGSGRGRGRGRDSDSNSNSNSNSNSGSNGDRQCLVWGRIDGGHLGVELTAEQLADESLVRRDEHGKPRICLRPVAVVAAPSLAGHAAHVGCGSGHTLFVDDAGQAFAAGFGTMGQLGLGSYDDVETARPLTCKALKGRAVTWAGAGGQFSIVAGPRGE